MEDIENGKEVVREKFLKEPFCEQIYFMYLKNLKEDHLQSFKFILPKIIESDVYTLFRIIQRK